VFQIVLYLAKGARGAAGQQRTGGRKRHATRGALHERVADSPFQALQLQTESRLGDAEIGGSAREMESICEGEKAAEMADLDGIFHLFIL
jgi:hypothetical protein